jgi:hypothetical protein
MSIRILAAIGLGTGCLLLAAEPAMKDAPKRIVQVSNTQHIDFPAGGTLRLKNSIGVLTVEAWDQPGVEITTIKSTKAEYQAGQREKAMRKLERVHVAAERRGDELVVTTEFPRFHAFPPPYPLEGSIGFNLEYHIKAPATTRIVDERHDVGEVNIDGFMSDIDVSLLQGEIMLHLPEDGQYNINARSDFGNVNSDFPGPDLYGHERRRWWLAGHRTVSQSSTSAHKLNLRVGFGDIVLLRIRVPKAPDSLVQAPKAAGL